VVLPCGLTYAEAPTCSEERKSRTDQPQHLRSVRVYASTGYTRVEGTRRASRSGLVSDLPREFPTVTIRNTCSPLHDVRRRTAMTKLRIVILVLGFGTARHKMVLE
jgi:hypothetical protein